MNAKRIIAQASAAVIFGMTLAGSLSAHAGQTLLNADFESGTDGFTKRSEETVERTTSVVYEGSGALMCSKRTDDWNGPCFSLDSSWKSGKTYFFSCAVRQDSGEDVQMKLSLQYSGASGTEYVTVASDTVPSGEWVILQNAAYTIPAEASSRVLYVETVTSKCDFYVDNVISEVPTVYRLGDVNHNEKLDSADIDELVKFLKGEDATVFRDTADMDGNGKIDAVDLTLRKQYLFNPELTRTTTTTTVTTTAPPKLNNEEWPELHPGDKWYNTADISWMAPGKKTVALSFDDGPCPNGENYGIRIQNALTKQGFHATFFYWGERIAGHENEIKSAEAGGHEVANHTWNHPDTYHQMDASSVLSQYTRVKDKLNEILGVKRDYLVRLPFLNNSNTISSTLPVPFPNCGINTYDYEQGHTAAQTVSIIQQAAQNGSLNGKVVLMHEVYDATATAVEQLAPWLDQQGYICCTVSEMFKYNGKDMYAGRTYDSCF